MIPTANMNLLIKGILARALENYPVKLCDYIFMANHLHMILIVKDPDDAKNFVGFIKAEITHAINRMLRRRQKSYWVKSFDSPVMLDPETVISKKAYLYANPSEAGLVDSISEYPGVSSWSAFSKGRIREDCYKVSRDKIIPLTSKVTTVMEQQELVKQYFKLGKKIALKLEPDVWVECFGEDEVNLEAANEEIKKRVTTLEAGYKAKREKEGKKAIGAYRLKLQSISKSYTPEKFGFKMLCLGKDKSIRAPFIKFFKEQCKVAREAYEAWKVGDYSKKIPPGMFAPRPPNLVCCLSI